MAPNPARFSCCADISWRWYNARGTDAERLQPEGHRFGPVQLLRRIDVGVHAEVLAASDAHGQLCCIKRFIPRLAEPYGRSPTVSGPTNMCCVPATAGSWRGRCVRRRGCIDRVSAGVRGPYRGYARRSVSGRASGSSTDCSRAGQPRAGGMRSRSGGCCHGLGMVICEGEPARADGLRALVIALSTSVWLSSGQERGHRHLTGC